MKESLELDGIDAVLPVIVLVAARRPTDPAGTGGRFADGPTRGGIAGVASESLADEAFEAAFAGVSDHAMSRLSSEWELPALLRHIDLMTEEMTAKLPGRIVVKKDSHARP